MCACEAQVLRWYSYLEPKHPEMVTLDCPFQVIVPEVTYPVLKGRFYRLSVSCHAPNLALDTNGKGRRGVLSKATYIDDILGRIFDIPNGWEKPAEFAKSWGAVE